ncbi:MAG: hypothetical protein WD825_09180 [Gemmatimonadaceae bacterium]
MLVTTACDAGFLSPADPDEPTELVYQLIPSGDPYSPAGILLRWTAPTSGRALTYDVYARSSTSEEFGLRATTTSTSFHDAGIPQLQYYVEALDADGESIGQSEAVEVDERNRLPAPRSLTSVTLNNAVQLQWDPNAYDAAPDLFDLYRVYSTAWSVAGGCDLSAWALEGTTVSDGFISRGLPNGETRCFAVSAISRDGHESLWSAVREDTPRYDARSIVLDASDIRRASSAFVFMSGTSGGFGAVVSDTTPGADVVLERRSDGALWFRAARPETRVMQYGVSPISDLTSIDRAPVAGYVDAARVMAGFGYVFRVQGGDGVRYAAVRVLHTTTDYTLFDFSFQSQVGNVELLRAP